MASETGETVLTGEDILSGQEQFLTYGLMEYGSVYGHGAYLGPDFTADYLHRQAVEMQQFYGGDARPGAGRSANCRPIATTRRPTPWSGPRGRSGPSRRSIEQLRRRLLQPRRAAAGLGPAQIPDPEEPREDHRLHRLDGLDRVGPPARAALLVHEQLAARTAGRQPADRGGRRLEHAVDHRPARAASA